MGVVPIVNENDTISVSVSIFFLYLIFFSIRPCVNLSNRLNGLIDHNRKFALATMIPFPPLLQEWSRLITFS